MIELRKEESQEILKGWFTQEQMKSELKWGSMLCLVHWDLWEIIWGLVWKSTYEISVHDG